MNGYLIMMDLCLIVFDWCLIKMDRCLMIKINALLDELVPNNNKTSLIMIHKCIIETKE